MPAILRIRLGSQPSRFLTDRAEAERAFQLAEQLGSVNAAAQQLGTTWPSLRKAFTRHGLGMPARNPEAVRQRAIAAARQRSGQPVTPPLDPVFAALNPDALPARPRSPAELHQWVRRDEEYATLGANVVVELNSERRAHRPTTRAWGRSSAALNALTATPVTVKAVPSAGRPTVSAAATAPAGPTNPRSGGWLPMPADPTPPEESSTSADSSQLILRTRNCEAQVTVEPPGTVVRAAVSPQVTAERRGHRYRFAFGTVMPHPQITCRSSFQRCALAFPRRARPATGNPLAGSQWAPAG